MAAGITGKAVMPFLLDAILKRTGGRSLATNVAVVKATTWARFVPARRDALCPPYGALAAELAGAMGGGRAQG